MSLQSAIAQRILQLCAERDITVNRLSLTCGITQSTLSNIVNGNSNNPTVATIKKICDGLDIRLEDFFASDLFRDLDQEIQ